MHDHDLPPELDCPCCSSVEPKINMQEKDKKNDTEDLPNILRWLKGAFIWMPSPTKQKDLRCFSTFANNDKTYNGADIFTIYNNTSLARALGLKMLKGGRYNRGKEFIVYRWEELIDKKWVPTDKMAKKIDKHKPGKYYGKKIGRP